MITHQELVEISKKWLKNTCNCGYIASEIVSLAGEVPDALGFKSDYTILIECKTSKSDFLADKNKIFRRFEDMGMGDFRFYLCEEGVILPSDLPDKWGLLYVVGKKVKKIVAPKGNIWYNQDSFKCEKRKKAEYLIMYSCLRRQK